jgi:hypothetical protein
MKSATVSCEELWLKANAGSHLNTRVKQGRVRLVPGWETGKECMTWWIFQCKSMIFCSGKRFFYEE